MARTFDMTEHMLSVFDLGQSGEARQRLNEIKTHIRFLVADHLDPSKVFSVQREEVTTIIKDLRETFPEIFVVGPKNDIARRVQLATKYINKHHSSLRHYYKQANPPSKRAQKQSLSANPPALPTADIYRRTRYNTRSAVNQYRANRNTSPAASSVDIYADHTPPPNPIKFHARYPRNIPPLITPSPSPTRTNASEVSEVRNFLAGCNPPMSHLLTQFMAYGCRNASFLSAVSKFSPEGIEEFIAKLSAHGNDDREITEMEKIILKMRFLEYKYKAEENNMPTGDDWSY